MKYKQGDRVRIKSLDWYNENKDELSDINKEVNKDTKDTINDLIEKGTSWYNENKDKITKRKSYQI